MNIIVNSLFNPFTFDDLMKPVALYKEDYEKVEKDFSDLTSLTEAWKDIATRENSPEAYAMYKRYSDQLNAVVNDFSRGMNSNNRRLLLNLKKRYALDITPIARASEAMKEANKRIEESGDDAFYATSRYNSIDPFLHGKTPLNRKLSKKEIQALTAAEILAAYSDIGDPDVKKVMEDTYFQVVTVQGGSMEDYHNAIQLKIGEDPILGNKFSEVRQRVADSIGYKDLDEDALKTADSAINLGMATGLLKSTVNYYLNSNHMTPYLGALLSISRSQERRALEAYDMKLGRAPIGLDEDGNYIFQNSLTGEIFSAPNADGSGERTPVTGINNPSTEDPSESEFTRWITDGSASYVRGATGSDKEISWAIPVKTLDELPDLIWNMIKNLYPNMSKELFLRNNDVYLDILDNTLTKIDGEPSYAKSTRSLTGTTLMSDGTFMTLEAVNEKGVGGKVKENRNYSVDIIVKKKQNTVKK